MKKWLCRTVLSVIVYGIVIGFSFNANAQMLASDAQVKVKWSNPVPTPTAPAATTIIVEHALSPEGPWDTDLGCTATGVEVDCITPKVQGGISHYFRVKACNSVGCVDSSAPVEANLNLPAARKVTGIRILDAQ